MIQLFNNNCFEVFDLLKDNSVDLVLTDIPYGTTKCKWDTPIDLEKMWGQINRIAKPNAAKVFTASQPFTSVLGSSNLKELKYSWTWVKSRATGHLNAKKMPMKNTEDILVFYKKPPVYNPQGVVECNIEQHNSASHSQRGKTTDATTVVTSGIEYKAYTQKLTNYPRQIIEIPSESKTIHGSQKPVKLMEYLIKTYSNSGQTVFDFTMGTGSTGIAANNLDRSFIGIEIDNNYYEAARKRILKT